MNFKCKELLISSDEHLGCTVTFSDSLQQDFHKTYGYDEIGDQCTYLLLQRSFGEDEFENDYCHIELSEFEKSTELQNFEIELSRNTFTIQWQSGTCTIDLDITKEDYAKLAEALKVIAGKRGKIAISR